MDIENYLLTKNDFELCTTGAFKNLLNETEFVDVTLACPDDKQVDAHKVVLSACSPFFRKILLKNRNKDQLIYLKGILHRDLMSILQFMYTGQTKVCKENLDGFLLAAQELQVEGLVYSELDQSKGKQPKLQEKLDNEMARKVDEIKKSKFEENPEPLPLPPLKQPLKQEPKTPKKITAPSVLPTPKNNKTLNVTLTPKKSKTSNVAQKSDFKCEECQLFLQNQNHFDVHNEMLHKQRNDPTGSEDLDKSHELDIKMEPVNTSLHDSKDNAIVSNVEESRNYSCETDGCEFSTEIRDELKSHILSLHLGLKKYSPVAVPEPMPDNEETTPNPDALNEDQFAIVPFTDSSTKSKTDRPDLERKFFCEICDFASAHKFNLKRHMTNIHGIASVDGSMLESYSEEDILGADFSLEEGDKKLSSKKKRTLTADHENVDPSQLLSCDRCDFTTTHIKSKRRHMMVIHEGLRFPCNYCSFQATQPYDVKKHVMKKHPEKV